MSLTLYFLRHGQTASSRANEFCGSIDPPLTPDGQAMAQAFGTAYRNLSWAGVYASPLQRAQATAKPLCDAVGLTPQVRRASQINYGKWEGQTVETVRRDFHDDYILWTADPGWYPPTGGEPAVAIAHRVLAVIEEIKGRHPTGNVLLVSHKATIRIALCPARHRRRPVSLPPRLPGRFGQHCRVRCIMARWSSSWPTAPISTNGCATCRELNRKAEGRRQKAVSRCVLALDIRAASAFCLLLSVSRRLTGSLPLTDN